MTRCPPRCAIEKEVADRIIAAITEERIRIGVSVRLISADRDVSVAQMADCSNPDKEPAGRWPLRLVGAASARSSKGIAGTMNGAIARQMQRATIPSPSK